MKYSYKATNESGELITGFFDAPDKFTLMKELRKEGKEVISAEETQSGLFSRLNDRVTAALSRVKAQEKVVFAKNLGAMIDAGLPMARALEVLRRQTKNKKFVKIIDSLSDEIRKGKTLSESMSAYPKVFSQLFVSMVHAGEESGSVSQSLHTVGEQLEKTLTLQKKIRGAMMYPAIISIVMCGIGVLMMIYVVPTLLATFKDLNVSLPWSTQLIIFISDLFTKHGLLLFIGVGSFVAVMSFISKQSWGKRGFDWMWLRMPIIGGLVKQINAARTARTLSSLLSSGVDMIVAIEITEQVLQNSYFKDVVSKARKVIQNGETMSSVFLANQKLYPSFVGEMMSVGEETGKITPMLMEVAIYYENEVDQRTKDMSTIIEPFLMVLIGAAVGFFAIAMLSPTYSVMSNIK